MSTTQQLASIHTFAPVANEGLEKMFSRFNLIARPLENERPPSLTEDQITTHYFHHLEAVLSAKNFRELERDIQEAERRRCGVFSATYLYINDVLILGRPKLS